MMDQIRNFIEIPILSVWSHFEFDKRIFFLFDETIIVVVVIVLLFFYCSFQKKVKMISINLSVVLFALLHYVYCIYQSLSYFISSLLDLIFVSYFLQLNQRIKIFYRWIIAVIFHSIVHMVRDALRRILMIFLLSTISPALCGLCLPHLIWFFQSSNSKDIL